MSAPPSDPRRRIAPDDPSWGGLLASYALMTLIPIALWVLASPLVRTAVIAAVLGLLAGARHAARLARCLEVCREVTFDLAGAIEVTIARVPTDDPN